MEFGHHVRLATNVNFSTFIKSAGIDFYPLGGDSPALARSFNVETVEYRNISFTVWDVGGQDTACFFEKSKTSGLSHDWLLYCYTPPTLMLL
ncbi:hypothetical protein ACSBR2_021332 [Camellia fascicularis]